jgi:hypothetical protein
MTNSIGAVSRGRASQIVAIQQKICTPVGTLTTILATVKKLSPIWWPGAANM